MTFSIPSLLSGVRGRSCGTIAELFPMSGNRQHRREGLPEPGQAVRGLPLEPRNWIPMDVMHMDALCNAPDSYAMLCAGLHAWQNDPAGCKDGLPSWACMPGRFDAAYDRKSLQRASWSYTVDLGKEMMVKHQRAITQYAALEMKVLPVIGLPKRYRDKMQPDQVPGYQMTCPSNERDPREQERIFVAQADRKQAHVSPIHARHDNN